MVVSFIGMFRFDICRLQLPSLGHSCEALFCVKDSKADNLRTGLAIKVDLAVAAMA